LAGNSGNYVLYVFSFAFWVFFFFFWFSSVPLRISLVACFSIQGLHGHPRHHLFGQGTQSNNLTPLASLPAP
jgi:hypothetical protein